MKSEQGKWLDASGIFAATLFLIFSFPVVLLAMEGSNKMKSASSPKGVLYVLTNNEFRRLDFETAESRLVFAKLFQTPNQLQHLGYFKSSKKLVFFDSGNKGSLSKAGRFLVANPKTEETQVFFHTGGGRYGLHSVSYSSDEKWFAIMKAKQGKVKFGSGGKPIREPFELWIHSIVSGDEIELDDNAWSSQLWLSDRLLIYVNFSEELMQIDIETKEKKNWGISNVYPLALSPNAKQILATDKERSKIYLLDVTSKSLKLVKEFRLHQLYGPMVWSPDGKSFVYNRWDLRDHLMPRYILESPWRLYWYDLETGKEKRISKNPWWKNPWEDIWLYSGAVWLPE